MAAGKMLELLVFFSTAGSLLLDLAAVLVCILAGPYYPTFRLPNQLMWWTSFCGAVPWGAVLLMLQVNCWCHGWEATNVDLLVLSAVQWVIACSTFGSACAALFVDQLAIQYGYCGTRDAVCSVYLVAAAISCAAGALAAASALGMLWILASRFRPLHAA